MKKSLKNVEVLVSEVDEFIFFRFIWKWKGLELSFNVKKGKKNFRVFEDLVDVFFFIRFIWSLFKNIMIIIKDIGGKKFISKLLDKKNGSGKKIKDISKVF